MRRPARNRQSPTGPGSGRDSQNPGAAISVRDMSEKNLLGDYLRARRELVSPESLGLPANGTRRVAGLRREEVAMLAGISSDYYLRLEQGRDRNPSPQVLEALARVLALDQTATDYLLDLAAQRPRPSRRPRREVVPSGARALLDVLGLPAFIEGRYFDVLAANMLATALSPNLRVGQNRLRAVFLDAGEKALYPDWEKATSQLIAGVRASIGTEVDDPRFVSLVGELSLSSERFRRLWARHDVHAPEGMPIRLQHPQVGELTLSREKLSIGGTAGQLLVIYHAEPGSSAAEKLALLGSLARPSAAPADLPVTRSTAPDLP
jgi:transcriptional regulator with XRE-family HTH domain